MSFTAGTRAHAGLRGSQVAFAARHPGRPATGALTQAQSSWNTITNTAHGLLASRTARLAKASPRLVCAAAPRPSVFLFGFGGQDYDDDYEEEYTVFKLQVGIFGDITKWQRDLDRLSSLYDTDEEGGLHAILREVLTLLLRNTEYVGYCTSGGRMFDNLDDTESKFNQVSFEERAKFREETLSNVDGQSARRAASISSGIKDMDQWMCVTLLVAVEGNFKLQRVTTVWELKQAIKALAGITVDQLVAFELLWTPQDGGDSYSKDELLADYPTLLTLS